MASVIAVIIVLAMNLVGSLLISALIIFPAISSMLVFKSFKHSLIVETASLIAPPTIGTQLSIVNFSAFLLKLSAEFPIKF